MIVVAFYSLGGSFSKIIWRIPFDVTLDFACRLVRRKPSDHTRAPELLLSTRRSACHVPGIASKDMSDHPGCFIITVGVSLSIAHQQAGASSFPIIQRGRYESSGITRYDLRLGTKAIKCRTTLNNLGEEWRTIPSTCSSLESIVHQKISR